MAKYRDFESLKELQPMERDKAKKKLQKYWGTQKFIFEAKFHIPKNITLREGTKPFGYFRNFLLDGQVIDYPIENSFDYKRRISIKHDIQNGLKDNESYEVEVDLHKDKYRRHNPFSLRIKRFKQMKNDIKRHSDDNDLVKVIKRTYRENTDFQYAQQMFNQATSIETLSTDIYAENKRFIYELIQNADDAALDSNAALSVDIFDKYVIVSHNGEPFDSRDIQGLCNVGMGTKADDASKTGYKGIGFKSVFGQPDGIVYVKTESTLFRFDRDFSEKKSWNHKKWGDKSTWEKEKGVQFKCPWQMMPILSDNIGDNAADAIMSRDDFSVKTAIKIKDGSGLYNDIVNIFEDAKFMLFLRRINTVSLNFKNELTKIEKINHNELSDALYLLKNDKIISSFFVKKWIHDIPTNIQEELRLDKKTPEKIQNMKKTEISFAFQLNETCDEIQLLKESQSPLYSYLPTETKEYNLPFIVNCNFLLDASREKIHKNRKWNEWLFNVIGYKTVECCNEFAKNNFFNSTYLSVLRNGYYNLSDNLSKKINGGLDKGFEKYPIVRNNENGLSKIFDIFFDPYHFNGLDKPFSEKIAEFLSNYKMKKTISPSNIITLSEHNRILKKFNPNELNESILQEFIGSEQIRDAITLKNNSEFLQFALPYEEKDPSGKWYSVLTNHQLIINQDSELDFITGVCFPMDISTDNEYQNRLIHESIYRDIKLDNELVNWLEKLGVTYPGSIAYLEKEIIGNIDDCVSNDNFLDITKFLFGLHEAGKLDDRHYIDLQELPLKTNAGFVKANKCILPNSYNPTIDFSQVLDSVNIVSEDYLEIANSKECRKFFKWINVLDDIDFIQSSKKLASELNKSYVDDANSFAKQGFTYPHLIGVFHPNHPTYEVSFFLQSFSFLDQITHADFSKLFWDRIFEKFRIDFEYTETSVSNYCPDKEFRVYKLGSDWELSTLDYMNWGRQPYNTVKIPNYFFWHIENIKCIPTTCGLSLAKDSFVNSVYNKELGGDFLPIVNLNFEVPDDWNKILKLKSNFSTKDLLAILQQIAARVHSKETLSKENQKRIGMVYNDLLKQLEIDRVSAREEIKDWSKNNQLISSSKKIREPHKLYWIKAPGFANQSSGIEAIYLPHNINEKNGNFELLLDSFGVRIIEDFDYQAENKKEFYDLKIKLLFLLGPLASILKYKIEIHDIDRFMSERYQKLSKVKFIICQNLRPVFLHDSEKIEGEPISHYFDKNKFEFLITTPWDNPVSLLNLSYSLAALISILRVEKEMMMLLGSNKAEVMSYLKILKLDPADYENCNSYIDILNLIKELEEKSKPNRTEVLVSPQDGTVKPENQKEVEEIQENDDGEEEESRIIYSEEEEEIIKRLFEDSLTGSQKNDSNLEAHIKALNYYKKEGYDISKAEKNFHKNFVDRYLFPVIIDGNEHKVMCRSAVTGLLYLTAHPWLDELPNENTELYILLGKDYDNCKIARNKKDLQSEDADYWLLRRDIDEDIEKLDRLLKSEKERKKLQILFNVKEGSPFESIFKNWDKNNDDGPISINEGNEDEV